MSTKADAKRARARLLREGVPWWLTLHILDACESGIDRTARQEKRAKALGTTFTLEDVWRNPNTCPMDVQWISDKLFWFEHKKRQRILSLFMKNPTIREFYAKKAKVDGTVERFHSRGETFDVDAWMVKRATTVSSLERLLALDALLSSSGIRSPVLLKAYIAACDKGGANFRKELDAKLKLELKYTSDAVVLYWETLVNAWWQTGKRPSWKQIVKDPE